MPWARKRAFSILVGLGFEDLDELGADDLPFLLRVGDARQACEELLRPIDDAQVHVEVVAEGGDDALPLVPAEQAVVHEDADELLADGLVQQRGDDGGIHPAAEAADDLGVADLLADRVDRLGDEVAHLPVAGAAADVVEEVLEDDFALGRVGDFGVELDAEEFLRAVPDRGVGAGLRRGQGDEVVVQVADLVAVADPDGVSSGSVASRSVLSRIVRVRPAVLAALGGDDFAAEDLAAELHAVADAEDRHAEVEDSLVASRGIGLVDAGRPAGEDDALERHLGQLLGGSSGPADAGVDVLLSHPAGDQLAVLAAEIQDGDHFANHKNNLIKRKRRGPD